MTINIHTSWHSNQIFCWCRYDSVMCVWVLCAVGDYFHPAAGSSGGEGGNVIYTLIMPAPLNTPLDKCNILDISSSLLHPHSPLFPSFCLNPPYVLSPLLIFALLIMDAEQCRCRGAAVIWVCVQNVQNRGRTFSLSFLLSVSLFLLLLPPSTPYKNKNATFIPPFPLFLHVNPFPGDQQTNPATTPQYHLPWGIKG